jgi:polyhydroxyalkanoate synthesis regulator protein
MTANAPILVKRCDGQRLYLVASGRYVAAADLRGWQLSGTDFVVRDARSGEDVTAAVLAKATALH